MSEPYACSPSPVHPDCSDMCQLREHKGYATCYASGECDVLRVALRRNESFEAFVERMEAEQDAPCPIHGARDPETGRCLLECER